MQGFSSQDILEKVKLFNPDLVGMSATTPDFKNALKIAKLIKENMNIFIALGGIHASSLPEYILEKYPQAFDVTCIGEENLPCLSCVAS